MKYQHINERMIVADCCLQSITFMPLLCILYVSFHSCWCCEYFCYLCWCFSFCELDFLTENSSVFNHFSSTIGIVVKTVLMDYDPGVKVSHHFHYFSMSEAPIDAVHCNAAIEVSRLKQFSICMRCMNLPLSSFLSINQRAGIWVELFQVFSSNCTRSSLP